MRILTALTLGAIVSAGPSHRLVAAPPAVAAPRALTTGVNLNANAPTSASAARGGSPRATREVTLPAGTSLTIVLEDGVGSDISRVEQPVHAHLSTAVRMHGETVLPTGSRVSGVVTDATRSAKVKGRAHVAIRFDSLMARGDDERYQLHTATIRRIAPATKRDDALKIGLPAAGGAIVGGLLGGEKGAVIGGAAAGGAGTAVVLTTRGKEVHLPKGTRLTIRLSQPLTVRIKG
jgi:hypothetical protein